MPVSPLKLQLSLKGRPIREYTFVRESVSIGREPGADILLDNAGVSRHQARLLRTPEGWVIEDARSSNGTWLNGHRAERERLRDRDEITIGKFSLRVSLVESRPDLSPPGDAVRRPAAAQIDATTVMTRGQLAEVFEQVQEGGAPPWGAFEEAAAPDSQSRAWTMRRQVIRLVTLLVSMAAGAALVALLMR